MIKTRVTIADVAQAAGVSAQTVSRVINGKGEISPTTRQLVMEVIERLGYRPSSIARSLATNRTLTLGLVVPDIANPFFAEIARGAEDVARARHYTIFVCNTVEDPRQEVTVLRLLEDKRVDGVILCSSRLADEELLPLLAAHSAVVVVNHPVPEGVAGVVRVDDAAGTKQAVNHLLARGRKTIALIAGPATSHSSRERIRGFEEAIVGINRLHDPDLRTSCQPNVAGGLQAAQRLIEARPDIDAIICYNDLVAVGVLQACAMLGKRVPDDIAIIGCDDILLAELVSPSLTTLHVSKYEIGTSAVRMLLDRLDGHSTAEVVLAPDLIVRASTQ